MITVGLDFGGTTVTCFNMRYSVLTYKKQSNFLPFCLSKLDFQQLFYLIQLYMCTYDEENFVLRR